MSRAAIRRHWAAGVAGVLAAFAAVSVVLALSGGKFSIEPSGLSGGGGRSSAGIYALQGALGQPFGGAVSGSGWVLTNGVFAGGGATDAPPGGGRLFAPNIVKNP